MELTKHHKKAYGVWAGSKKGHAPIPEKCANEVGSSFTLTQCYNLRKSDTLDGAFCRIHDPIRVQAKREKLNAKFAQEEAEADRKRAIREMEQDAVEILLTIAEGHNDPRRLALSFKERWDAKAKVEAVIEQKEGE